MAQASLWYFYCWRSKDIRNEVRRFLCPRQHRRHKASMVPSTRFKTKTPRPTVEFNLENSVVGLDWEEPPDALDEEEFAYVNSNRRHVVITDCVQYVD